MNKFQIILDFYSGTIILNNFDKTIFSLQPLKGRLLLFTQTNESSHKCNHYYNDKIERGTRFDFHMEFSNQNSNGIDNF